MRYYVTATRGGKHPSWTAGWEWHDHEAEEERYRRRRNWQDAVKSKGPPVHRNPHPFPDATDCVYKRCACGESFLHPMGGVTTPDACPACRSGKEAA